MFKIKRETKEFIRMWRNFDKAVYGFPMKNIKEINIEYNKKQFWDANWEEIIKNDDSWMNI